MLCLKKLIIGSGIFLPVLLSLLFVSPSYAIDDISITYTSSPSAWTDVFPNCTGLCLSDYSYLIIEHDYVVNNFSTFNLQVRMDGSSGRSFTIPYYSYIFSFPFDFVPSSYNYLQFGSDGIPSSFLPVTFTLTNSLSSCPDPEPCPVVPDTPYRDQLNNITMAIYTCGGILLVLYFFYCIYRIIIKNSGVSNL